MAQPSGRFEYSKLYRKEKTLRCPDECTCKMKKALELIVEEIEKVYAAMKNLAAKDSCPCVPMPAEKKEFAKTVEMNSSACHVIIGELKKQRNEINEMLQMYEESTRNFQRIEATLGLHSGKIERIEAALDSAEKTVSNVRRDIAKRHENFRLEMKSRRERVETRREIPRVFVNWALSLDAKLCEEREASDVRVKEAIEESNKDRTMLTLAVGQLREVRKIEILLMTQQRSAMTRNARRDKTPCRSVKE